MKFRLRREPPDNSSAVIARLRLFQIDLWRRRGLVPFAEVFGPATPNWLSKTLWDAFVTKSEHALIPEQLNYLQTLQHLTLLSEKRNQSKNA